MSAPKEDGKQNDNMELPKQQGSACGPDCGCHASASSGKTRWLIGAIVLVAAGILVVRAVTKSNATSSLTTATTFANPVASQTTVGASGASAESAATIPAAETSVGTTIGAFSELTTMAAKTDAVLIFVPGKDGASANAPSAPMRSAARMIESKAGLKCGLFTLKAGSHDHAQIATEMSVPGVLAMVKGRGVSAVTGEITEAKLLQGYVGACSSSGCPPGASAGCCPK